MEHLTSLGRSIPDSVGPTYQLYGDLLRQPSISRAIRKTQRQELSYGPHRRQKLDLYSSSHADTLNKSQRQRVLIFVYGGGFVSGEKRLSGIPGDVAYSNLGHFFAENFGFETIVMDYRLLGHGAKYPSGVEDVSLCLEFVSKHFGNDSDVYMLGNSAGGVHVASWLFGKEWSSSRDRLLSGIDAPKLHAVGLLGCPFRLDPQGGMKPMLKAYYGTPEDTKSSEPTSLMLRAGETASWPRMMTLVSELDPDEIIESGREFARLWEETGGKGDFLEIKGHNHISPPLALGTGIEKEEEWAFKFGRWLLKS